MREKRFALSLGLPEDSTGDCARVTLVGQSAALVEGQHGVIEPSLCGCPPRGKWT